MPSDSQYSSQLWTAYYDQHAPADCHTHRADCPADGGQCQDCQGDGDRLGQEEYDRQCRPGDRHRLGWKEETAARFLGEKLVVFIHV